MPENHVGLLHRVILGAKESKAVFDLEITFN